jgi:nitrogen-specific signal transduction histidine kinase
MSLPSKATGTQLDGCLGQRVGRPAHHSDSRGKLRRNPLRFRKGSGAGFADGDLSKLFDSLFSTNETGMGLGLSIARSIVEAHGGTIQAENSAGGGPVFHIRVPAHEVSENVS